MAEPSTSPPETPPGSGRVIDLHALDQRLLERYVLPQIFGREEGSASVEVQACWLRGERVLIERRRDLVGPSVVVEIDGLVVRLPPATLDPPEVRALRDALLGVDERARTEMVGGSRARSRGRVVSEWFRALLGIGSQNPTLHRAHQCSMIGFSPAARIRLAISNC